MKFKQLAAGTAAALLFLSSCKSTGKTETPNPLIGSWKIDSLGAGSDSNSNIGLLLLAMTLKDSAGAAAHPFTFTQDSLTFTDGEEKKSVAYTFDPASNRLMIPDEKDSVFYFRPLGPGLVVLKDKDSIALYLRRL